jgi:hypothetical protein
MGGRWHRTSRIIYIYIYIYMRTITVFLCIRESYKQLRGLSLLVIGCHT